MLSFLTFTIHNNTNKKKVKKFNQLLLTKEKMNKKEKDTSSEVVLEPNSDVVMIKRLLLPMPMDQIVLKTKL